MPHIPSLRWCGECGRIVHPFYVLSHRLFFTSYWKMFDFRKIVLRHPIYFFKSDALNLTNTLNPLLRVTRYYSSWAMCIHGWLLWSLCWVLLTLYHVSVMACIVRVLIFFLFFLLEMQCRMIDWLVRLAGILLVDFGRLRCTPIIATKIFMLLFDILELRQMIRSSFSSSSPPRFCLFFFLILLHEKNNNNK